MNGARGYRRIRKDRNAQRPRTLEAWVAAYLSLREALGLRTSNSRKILRRLVAFMHDRRIASFERVDRDAALAWLYGDSPQEGTVWARLAPARGFFHYLLSLGAVTEDVWDSFSYARRKLFVPHIFSLAELQAVLGHVRNEIGPNRPKSSHVHAAYHAVFHTLYACGLRSGEVCRLEIRDVDFERSLLTVKNTKFWKSRVVPFNTRTHELLRGYLERSRPREDGRGPQSAFFLNYRRRPFTTWTIGAHLAAVCRAIGIYRRKEMKGNTVYGATNVHALRHTFAVHRLLKWYEDGADVNSKLPFLATYMGHSHYHCTQRYLTILPRFIDMAGKLFSDMFEGPLKDLE